MLCSYHKVGHSPQTAAVGTVPVLDEEQFSTLVASVGGDDIT